jgi:multiple antibiotic resistance protein
LSIKIVILYPECVEFNSTKTESMFTLFITSCISLFSLINPLSAIPVFISLTSGYSPGHLRVTIRKTAVYIFIICLVSFFIGNYILEFFGISIHALKLAGGIIISRSGFLLLNSQHKNDIQGEVKEESLVKEDISFSPLAMPLLAGPGSISLLINLSLTTETVLEKMISVAAIFVVSLVIFFIFFLAPKILKYLGQAGIRSMSKIMGFIVLSLGIQMVVDSLNILLKL